MEQGNASTSGCVHVAANYDRNMFLNMLLDMGAPINEVNREGETPLQVAYKMVPRASFPSVISFQSTNDHRSDGAHAYRAPQGNAKASKALVRRGAVLPETEKARIARTEIHTPMWVVSDAAREAIDLIERAVEKRQVLTIDYTDEAGRASVRDIRPLGLWFWGKVWTLVAWCEMRGDFRAFRVDRLGSVVIAGRIFKPERGKQLADFYRAVERSGDQAILLGTARGG